MNVLDATRTPRVMDLKEVIQAFLDHRREVLQRRSRFRLSKIEDRMEILDGLRIAYLNIDEVIRIVRFEDHPKDALIKAFKLSDRQAEAILNMRLRALSKLREIEIQSEYDELAGEKKEINSLLKSDKKQWAIVCLLYTSPSPRDGLLSRMPSSA